MIAIESLSKIMLESMNQMMEAVAKIDIRQIMIDSKGMVGEAFTTALFYFLDKDVYKPINDIIIKVGNKTAQIDHVLISKYGIFVLETKNYKGLILGNETDQYWKQNLYNGSKRFYNPIIQNQKHIEVLKAYLCEYPRLVFRSIIVFGGQDIKLRVKTVTDVVSFFELLNCINKYNVEVISEDIVDSVFKKLQEQKNHNLELKQEHVYNIKQMKDKLGSKKENDICPKCGKGLVERNGKYGRFVGCSGYPRCKFTTK